MEKNKPTRYNMIRLEDMCGGHSKDYAGKLLTDVLGDRIVADNPAATVNTAECRIGKYKVLFVHLNPIFFFLVSFFYSS